MAQFHSTAESSGQAGRNERRHETERLNHPEGSPSIQQAPAGAGHASADFGIVRQPANVQREGFRIQVLGPTEVYRNAMAGQAIAEEPLVISDGESEKGDTHVCKLPRRRSGSGDGEIGPFHGIRKSCGIADDFDGA